MTLELKPRRGGFLRPFGCGWFIREYLSGNAPFGAPEINPDSGAPQAEIFHDYKIALMRATSSDKATRIEEQRARREKRPISPSNIEKLSINIFTRMPYKAQGCRYHSFVVYFSNLNRLGWVESTGREEPSTFQSNYPPGQARKYYRLTSSGKEAGDAAWANPRLVLYS